MSSCKVFFLLILILRHVLISCGQFTAPIFNVKKLLFARSSMYPDVVFWLRSVLENLELVSAQNGLVNPPPPSPSRHLLSITLLPGLPDAVLSPLRKTQRSGHRGQRWGGRVQIKALRRVWRDIVSGCKDCHGKVYVIMWHFWQKFHF